jgi:hypothetical protein
MKPLPSVFSPISRSPSRRTVLTAPITCALAAISSRCWITATLCGMVQFTPRKLFIARIPCTAPARFAAVTSKFR